MKKQEPTVHTINMTVLDDGDFLSPYSETSTPVISSGVAEFIENCANASKLHDSFELTVHSDCIDADKQAKYDNAIRNYFNLKLNAEHRELHRNNVISLVFAIVGILGLAFMIICDQVLDFKEIWVEVIDIFAWVFLWEAVDQFFIERRKLLLNKRRLKNFTEMPIRFQPLTNREKQQ